MVFRTHDIIILTIAIYLGEVTSDLFRSITRDIFVPLVSPFVSKDELGKMRYNFFGYVLDFGDVFLHLIRMFVAVVMVLIFVRLVRIYAKGALKHFYV